jgi:hypothetical protein
MGVTAGIFLASILLKEMCYLVYIRYLWSEVAISKSVDKISNMHCKGTLCPDELTHLGLEICSVLISIGYTSISIFIITILF